MKLFQLCPNGSSTSVLTVFVLVTRARCIIYYACMLDYGCLSDVTKELLCAMNDPTCICEHFWYSIDVRIPLQLVRVKQLSGLDNGTLTFGDYSSSL